MQPRFRRVEGLNSGVRTECHSGPGSVGLQSGVVGWPLRRRSSGWTEGSQAREAVQSSKQLPLVAGLLVRCLQSPGAPERSSSAKSSHGVTQRGCRARGSVCKHFWEGGFWRAAELHCISIRGLGEDAGRGTCVVAILWCWSGSAHPIGACMCVLCASGPWQEGWPRRLHPSLPQCVLQAQRCMGREEEERWQVARSQEGGEEACRCKEIS